MIRHALSEYDVVSTASTMSVPQSLLLTLKSAKVLSLQAGRHLHSSVILHTSMFTAVGAVPPLIPWFGHPTWWVQCERVTLSWLHYTQVWQILVSSLRATMIFLTWRRDCLEFLRIHHCFLLSFHGGSLNKLQLFGRFRLCNKSIKLFHSPYSRRCSLKMQSVLKLILGDDKVLRKMGGNRLLQH